MGLFGLGKNRERREEMEALEAEIGKTIERFAELKKRYQIFDPPLSSIAMLRIKLDPKTKRAKAGKFRQELTSYIARLTEWAREDGTLKECGHALFEMQDGSFGFSCFNMGLSESEVKIAQLKARLLALQEGVTLTNLDYIPPKYQEGVSHRIVGTFDMNKGNPAASLFEGCSIPKDIHLVDATFPWEVDLNLVSPEIIIAKLRLKYQQVIGEVLMNFFIENGLDSLKIESASALLDNPAKIVEIQASINEQKKMIRFSLNYFYSDRESVSTDGVKVISANSIDRPDIEGGYSIEIQGLSSTLKS